jgi:hypothetical protein
MTIFEFNEQLCEIIAGEDAYYNYSKEELLNIAKKRAEEYNQEDNDEYDVTELERDELLRKHTEVCDIIGGEDAYKRFTHNEIMDMLKDMSTSHEEYQNELECRDAAEVHELMNPAVCDV